MVKMLFIFGLLSNIINIPSSFLFGSFCQLILPLGNKEKKGCVGGEGGGGWGVAKDQK
jgi:hypothetical protein